MTQAEQVSRPSIRVYGYCDKSSAQLEDIAQKSNYSSLRYLSGEYTIVIEKPDETVVITSPVGAIQYFYCIYQTHFYHGKTLLEVLQATGLPWQWNWEALGDLCQLENTTDNQTLHQQIQRVPPGSFLTFKGQKLVLDTFQYIDTIPVSTPSPYFAIEALNEEIARLAGSNPYLSLSGGFDSRVILSSLLKQGIKPHLITMGNEHCTDVQVAKQIASRFCLSHDLIRLSFDDLEQHAQTISQLTSGTKTAWHWHTYIYPLKASLPSSSTFFVGTLGEFARSYYFDKGKLGILGNIFGSQALASFWKLKLNRHPTFQSNELNLLSTPFQQQLNESGVRQRISKLIRLCHYQFLPGLTRYYFEQRVPSFYANGIQMYLASTNWRSPFHSQKWIDAIWNLPFKWKLGSNWHRLAIYTNFPSLLEFPEENGFNNLRMLKKAPPFYWTPPLRRTSYVSYDQSDDWYAKKSLHAFIRDHLDSVDDLLDPKLVNQILVAQEGGEQRTRTIAFILTMIHWKLNVEKLMALSPSSN